MKEKSAVYCLQISASVSEISKFEKSVKHAKEMTDDVICTCTQPNTISSTLYVELHVAWPICSTEH